MGGGEDTELDVRSKSLSFYSKIVIVTSVKSFEILQIIFEWVLFENEYYNFIQGEIQHHSPRSWDEMKTSYEKQMNPYSNTT